MATTLSSAAPTVIASDSSHGIQSMQQSSSNGPTWDEQIVPTLRKRLEAESQCLSHRLSGSSDQANHPFDSTAPSHIQPVPHQAGRGYPYAQNGDPRKTELGKPTALSPPSRTRTESTPLAVSAPSGSSKPPMPSSSKVKTPSPNSQSRIPFSRSRSGSSVAGSSSSHQQASSPLGVSPPANSGIPIPISRSRSRKASIDSIDLKAVEDRGRIQDERPPFLVTQPSRDFDKERSMGRRELDTREALDIAQKGHATSGGKRGRQSMGGEEIRRQRADTLKALADPKPHLDRTGELRSGALPRTSMDPRLSSRSSGGIPRSSTSGQLGLGQPSTPINKTPAASRTTSSGSKLRTKPGSSGFSQSQRSASLNMLASSTSTPPSQRLGIAAHFKPPESGFTPPRGTDWDDVVLPAVAKKMGTPTSASPSTVLGDEESFVVEWDRDGQPLKWQKGKLMRDKDGNISVSPTVSTVYDYDPSKPKPSPASSAFSPTFEMSPDNPFPSTPTRGPTAKGIELGPIPTTTKYGDVSPGPTSPSPFTSYKSGSDAPPDSPNKAGSSKRSLTRKPSFLKSMTSSDDLKRPRNARNDSRTRAPPTIEVEPATPAQGTFPQHSTFPPPEKWKPQSTRNTATTPGTRRRDDEIKKGKCCIIM